MLRRYKGKMRPFGPLDALKRPYNGPFGPGRDATFLRENKLTEARNKRQPKGRRHQRRQSASLKTAATLAFVPTGLFVVGVVEEVEGEFGVVAGAGDVDGDYGAGAVFFKEGIG